MHSYEKLLLANKAWAREQKVIDPEFFDRLSSQQAPEFLWIGCSDSRVPADKITGTDPGEIFVHRNIANLVVSADINLLSVLQYAVEVLKVKHIIVCGHYGCGGVKAAMSPTYYGIINQWIKNIKDIYQANRAEVDSKPTEEERLNRLVELNVIEQVTNVARTSIVQKAWAERNGPQLHGWVYGLNNGLINPICEMDAGSLNDDLYTFKNL
ncbi:MAG TPA: carbonic anhydrase [Ferruginibacter sp.]|nr:carbonic anhydrase [Ferruginibacter sp.]HRO17034.1 carbonic anhydrase [Ferruginibacter sp.]HRQ20000.1 carbonic anhydrase [Ferruginibacter sp.]